jgi:hypothetical protein
MRRSVDPRRSRIAHRRLPPLIEHAYPHALLWLADEPYSGMRTHRRRSARYARARSCGGRFWGHWVRTSVPHTVPLCFRRGALAVERVLILLVREWERCETYARL